MDDYGIKVVKKGKSITSTNICDYSLHSGINTLKLLGDDVFDGNFNLTVQKGIVSTKTLSHNLGYKPMVFAFFKHPETNRYCAMPCRTFNYSNQPPTWDLIGLTRHLNNNQVQVRLYDGDPPMSTGSTTVNVKCYIAIDPRKDSWYEPAQIDTDNHVDAGDYGVKISRKGIDVKTASPKNLVFSSSCNTFKIYRTIKISGGESITHGLNYPPTFFAFKREWEQTGSFEGKYIRGDVAPFMQGAYPLISVDNTKVYCKGNSNELIYVILCVDPLNE